jgi:hypothetical protein
MYASRKIPGNVGSIVSTYDLREEVMLHRSIHSKYQLSSYPGMSLYLKGACMYRSLNLQIRKGEGNVPSVKNQKFKQRKVFQRLKEYQS